MAQSPYTLLDTGSSSVVGVVDLGGVHRKLQIAAYIDGAVTASPTLVIERAEASSGPVPQVTSQRLFSNEVTSTINYSGVIEGFFRYIRAYQYEGTFTGNVKVNLYFDGAQWP